MGVNFGSTTILGRTAPIYTYSNSGPRSVSFSFRLHREMMNDIDITGNNLDISPDTDVVDELVNHIQAAALPKYTADLKAINPPIIAIRLGNNLYVKGIVIGNVSVKYSGPILNDNKYAIIDISFTVDEINPYDADAIKTIGSSRGVEKHAYKRLY